MISIVTIVIKPIGLTPSRVDPGRESVSVRACVFVRVHVRARVSVRCVCA